MQNRTIVLVMFTLLMLHGTASAQPAPLPPRSISTSGEAVVYVVPDEVVIRLGVETYDPDLDKTVTANDTASARLVKALKELGVEDKHVQTDTLSVDIRYKHSNAPHGVEGYTAQRMYAVTLKDTKRLEKLVTTALHNGANRLDGLEYRTTELRKHRDEARTRAIRAAREKAVLLAKELDCTVGKPRAIHEGSVSVYGWGRASNWQSNAQIQVSAPIEGGGDEQGQIMPLGQIGVRAGVSVTFDLAE